MVKKGFLCLVKIDLTEVNIRVHGRDLEKVEREAKAIEEECWVASFDVENRKFRTLSEAISYISETGNLKTGVLKERKLLKKMA